MPRQVVPTAKQIAAFKEPGRHAVGGGAYLVITKTVTREWWARGADPHGRRRWVVIGNADTITPAEARATATTAIAKAAAQEAAPTGALAFLEAAAAYMADRQAVWKHKAHRAQWQHSIDLVPTLHRLRADKIGARDVAAALMPLQDRPETLQRTRGRIEQIIDAELIGAGILDRPNPAALRTQRHLVPALAPDQRRKARKAIEHHAAMALDAARDLWHRIPNTVPGRALRLLLLTATRTSEIRLAQWKHWDPKTRVLTIPPENAKNGVAHAIPVPTAALAFFQNPRQPSDFVFTHARSGKHLSQDAMRMVLRRAGVATGEGAVHGFRSTFRDWCRATGKDEVLAELALAHTVGDSSQRAYARGTALERRRDLMEQWAEALTAPPAADNVTQLRGAK
jgi:integrase